MPFKNPTQRKQELVNETDQTFTKLQLSVKLSQRKGFSILNKT